MAVGGADQEARLALAAVAPGFELLRELDRGQRLAALVEHDGDAVRAAGSGTLPPLSGNSVTLVGQAIRFR